MKKTASAKNGDWHYLSKRVYRSILREFIGQHFKPREFESLKVVCFPGRDAAEIFEVYDPLGIRRKNIIGIEEDPEIAERLKVANLGIRVEPYNALYFFKHNRSQLCFDIINLDFLGMQTGGIVELLRWITAARLLSNKAVLGTNFFGSMEQFGMQMDYYEDLTREERISKTDGEIERAAESAFKLEEYQKARKVDTFSQVRSEALTKRILDCCIHARTNFFKLRPETIESIRRYARGEAPVKTDSKQSSSFSNSDDGYYNLLLLPGKNEDELLNEARKSIENMELDHILHGEDVFAAYRLALRRKPYFVEGCKRIQYPGKGGHPMYSDFFYLETHDRFFQVTERGMRHSIEVNKHSSVKIKRVHNRALRKIKNSLRCIREGISRSYRFPPRIKIRKKDLKEYEKGLPASVDLDEIVERERRREELSKLGSYGHEEQRINILLGIQERIRDGTLKEYFNLTTSQLSARKAWLKRGLLEKLLKQESAKGETSKHCPEEDAQNFEAYFAILNGESDDVIIAAHNLGKMQLAGYKASLRRGGNLVHDVYSRLSQETKEQVIKRVLKLLKENGTLFVDSDLKRAIKNNKRIISSSAVNTVGEIRNGYGLYIVSVNAGDNSRTLEDIGLLSTEELFIPNVCVVCPQDSMGNVNDTAEVVRELGGHLRLFLYKGSNGYIDRKVTLEQLLRKSAYASFI